VLALLFHPGNNGKEWKVRNRFKLLKNVCAHLADLFLVLSLLLLLPAAIQEIYSRLGYEEASVFSYLIPSAVACGIGGILRFTVRKSRLSRRGGMMVCALGWILISAVGAIPFMLVLDVGYLDAYFETVSGFTTTGITMLTGLDGMPRSIIFWRALIQWLGGLGILTFFLAVVGAGEGSHRLFSAESHKIFSRRPAPGLSHTLRILWFIYGGLTAIVAVMLIAAGTSPFDAVAHAFTCLSTGGYSPYDASIGHYAEAGYRHYVLIEYILIFGMVLGGTNFFIHFRLLTGDVKSLWDNTEVRLWWGILGAATFLVVLNHWLEYEVEAFEPLLRTSLFQVVAIGTTTGYATESIGAPYFPALAKQIFLILMVIGGCVGSTGGGIKVLRVGVLFKMVARQIKSLLWGMRSVNPLVVDGEQIDVEEIRRIAALFFAWVVLLAIGAGVTALFSNLGPMESASGMFSALGNIGPCYISVEGMTQLHPVVKITYITGMLAGRLEILPILLIFSRKAWR
jgi:trk system potassium uptake protein TrkH